MRTRAVSLSDYAVAAFRIVIGFLFFCHGTTSLWAWPAEPYGGNTAQVGAWPGWWGAVIQVVCGAALMLGLGTRIAAFLASGSMAYAYFWMHQSDGALPIQNDGELSAVFCWALFLLVFLGAGPLSIDGLLRGRRDAFDSGPVESATEPGAPGLVRA